MDVAQYSYVSQQNVCRLKLIKFNSHFHYQASICCTQFLLTEIQNWFALLLNYFRLPCLFLGIGYRTALEFAKRGARVILACRNQNKAAEAREHIIKATDNNNVVVEIVDLSSFESVRKFASKINVQEERLDILVNNAGLGGLGRQKTKDGMNAMMQINYLSNFLLTHLLIGKYKCLMFKYWLIKFKKCYNLIKYFY